VTGAGDFFSAGFDLSEFRAAADDAALAERLWQSSDRFHQALLRFPLPLIAAVNGPALAGGFDLAVCCDLRIAAEGARFAHPEFAFGDVVYAPLHDAVGGALAREICLTGRELAAREALARGLVSEVVARDQLEGAVERIVQRIVRAPRDRLLRSKAKAVARAAIPADRATLDL
jgi:enoyl-CoA hydratase